MECRTHVFTVSGINGDKVEETLLVIQVIKKENKIENLSVLQAQWEKTYSLAKSDILISPHIHTPRTSSKFYMHTPRNSTLDTLDTNILWAETCMPIKTKQQVFSMISLARGMQNMHCGMNINKLCACLSLIICLWFSASQSSLVATRELHDNISFENPGPSKYIYSSLSHWATGLMASVLITARIEHGADFNFHFHAVLL